MSTPDKERRGPDSPDVLKRLVAVGRALAETRDQLAVFRILREFVVSVEAAGQLIVVKTPPGSAHLVASAIDHAQLPEIAGTVSGDDTMFVAVRDGVAIRQVLDRFERMLGREKPVYA